MMNKIKSYFSRNKAALTSRTAKLGGYSFVLSIIVLAILIAVNVAVSSLPSTWTNFDISAARLYSVTSSTKSVVQNLDEDVTIYWVTQENKEDSVVEKLLNVYDALSDNLTVVKKNPDIYPTFAAQYTTENVTNNSLIVECGDRSRYISYADIYEADTSDYYTKGSVSYSFNGEGLITTAIDYVTREDLPKIYTITGHGEAELSDTFSSALQKQNIETRAFSLLEVDKVPEEAAAVLINSPTNDITAEEADMLNDYISDGGRLIVISGPQESGTLENLNSVVESYGVKVREGIVIESSRSYYAFGKPYTLLPELGESDITSAMAANNNIVVLPIAEGLTIDEDTTYNVTSLLYTSNTAFSKVAGYDLTTYEREDGDISGPFSLAVSVETFSGGELVWIGCDNIMDDLYNSYSSGANSDFVMNAISWLIGETDSISIRSKSLDYNYLTITDAQAMVIKIWMLAVVPLAYLIFGIDDVVRRRKQA